MDFKNKMLKVGKELNNNEITVMKFLFSDMIKDSILENITNGCELIRVLEPIFDIDPAKQKDFLELLKTLERHDLIRMFNSQQTQPDKLSNVFRNPVFLAEFCKKIGYDWKCLGYSLSISQIELDAIEYAYDSLDMRSYAMLSKCKKWKPDDIIRALINMDRIDLVNEIERLTNISKDVVLLKSSGGNLECDKPKKIDQLQCFLGLTSLQNRIDSLYKNGTDKIRTFNASDATIDLGVEYLNKATRAITENLELLNNERMVEILFNLYIFIGDIYTSTYNSKFQGNIYTKKTSQKYQEAINAYENGFKYSIILENDYEYGRFIHKLVTRLNKPAEYGYGVTVRDQVKYNEYFSKYKSTVLDRYEEGMRCLQERDFKNAVYFFEKEIENSKRLETKGRSLIHVAMEFQFLEKKTKENFQKVVRYYEEAVDIFINKGATDIAGEVTVCYYYLYRLFSNPSCYGFDNNLNDVFKESQVFRLKEKHLEGNVHRLLVQAELYACARFPWLLDKTDLDTNKVLEYCKKALNASNGNLEVETKIYYLMAHTYSSLITEKSFDVYLNAIRYCQKALETFKTRQKRRDQEYAERVVTESMTLAYFPKTRGFQGICKNDSKPLQHLLEKIYESNEYKIDHFKEMKDYQMLRVSDSPLQRRIKNLYDAEISVKNEFKCKGYQQSLIEEKETVISTTNKLQEIEKNHHLYYYYFGFIKTFSKSYHAALAVISGQFALDLESKILKTSTFIIDLIPIFGKFLAFSTKEIVEYLKSVEIRNAAIHLSSLSSRANEFENMVQDIIVEIIFDNKDKFLTKSFDHRAKTWFEKINNFCRNVLEHIDEAIYVQEFPEDLHKLGYRDAVKIIRKHISNGNIYGGKLGASLLPNDKKELLKRAIYNEAINCQQSKKI